MLLVTIFGVLAAAVGAWMRQINLIFTGFVLFVSCGIGYASTRSAPATVNTPIAFQSDKLACETRGGRFSTDRRQESSVAALTPKCSI
jgi:hypothetical protein